MGFAMEAAIATNTEHPHSRPRLRGGWVDLVHAIETQTGHSRPNQSESHTAGTGMPSLRLTLRFRTAPSPARSLSATVLLNLLQATLVTSAWVFGFRDRSLVASRVSVHLLSARWYSFPERGEA